MKQKQQNRLQEKRNDTTWKQEKTETNIAETFLKKIKDFSSATLPGRRIGTKKRPCRLGHGRLERGYHVGCLVFR